MTITDKYTQSDFSIPKQFIVEETEGGTRYSYIVPKATKENISEHIYNIRLPNDVSHFNIEKRQSTTPIIDKQIEKKEIDVNKKDLTRNKNISTMTDKTISINNEICTLFNAIISSEIEDLDITNRTNITDDSKKSIDNNDLRDIFGSSENYKIFANKLYTSIEKLFKSGVFSKNINKLNEIAVLFDYIIDYCIKEFKYSKHLNTSDCIKDCNTKDQVNNQETRIEEIPCKKGKSIESEIELHLQIMKQERIDEDEDRLEISALEIVPEKERIDYDEDTLQLPALELFPEKRRVDYDEDTLQLPALEIVPEKKRIDYDEDTLQLPPLELVPETERIDYDEDTLQLPALEIVPETKRIDYDEDTLQIPVLDLNPENQTFQSKVLQNELFNQDKQQQQHVALEQQYQHHREQQQKQQLEQQKQQQPQQIKSISYNPYFNLFMTQQQNENNDNRIKGTRTHCPPVVVQNLPQNQTYNPNYYTNQEFMNKNYRYPYKQSYKPNTPYQRPQQVKKVPTPQPPLPQSAYTYPQFYQQQNVHMQTHVQEKNTQNPRYY